MCINYKTEDFVARVKQETEGRGTLSCTVNLNFDFCWKIFPCIEQSLFFGANYLKRSMAGVDVILDSVGGPYLQKNFDSLNVDGRLFIIGALSGMAAEINLSSLLARRLTIQGLSVSRALYFYSFSF